jgi:16S rRNA (uracil1498-N3)-methyltransferase
MRRFFIDKKNISAGTVIIKGEEAHHIKDVIRLRTGDRFLGFDGEGNTYTLRIIKLKDYIEAEIEKVTKRELVIPKILLACALPKKNKIEYIIEKATELGVAEIVPMITERTIVKISEKEKAAKQKRWEKIALEASKQCARNTLPKIYEPTNLKEAIKKIEVLGYRKKIIPCLCEGTRYLNEVISKDTEEAAVVVGPEGGFTRNEIDFARENGFESVSLGPLILKVDTACLYTLSVLQNIFNIQGGAR